MQEKHGMEGMLRSIGKLVLHPYEQTFPLRKLRDELKNGGREYVLE
jgi:hypothetical protein